MAEIGFNNLIIKWCREVGDNVGKKMRIRVAEMFKFLYLDTAKGLPKGLILFQN